jgi:hypothetical protein
VRRAGLRWRRKSTDTAGLLQPRLSPTPILALLE